MFLFQFNFSSLSSSIILCSHQFHFQELILFSAANLPKYLKTLSQQKFLRKEKILADLKKKMEIKITKYVDKKKTKYMLVCRSLRFVVFNCDGDAWLDVIMKKNMKLKTPHQIVIRCKFCDIQYVHFLKRNISYLCRFFNMY